VTQYQQVLVFASVASPISALKPGPEAAEALITMSAALS
jgi:hypothetical protein